MNVEVRNDWSEKIDSLIPESDRRRLLHALLALGHPLSCEIPNCVCDDRDLFEVQGGKKISINHITQRSAGGTDHAGNLRISHFACNISAGMTGRRTLSAEDRFLRSLNPIWRVEGLPYKEWPVIMQHFCHPNDDNEVWRMVGNPLKFMQNWSAEKVPQ